MENDYTNVHYTGHKETTMQFVPFLLFNGNCREVMNFYAELFGGMLELVTYADSPADEIPRPRSASGREDDIIHSALRYNDDLLPFLTAADLPSGSTTPISNGLVCINCTSYEHVEHLLRQLSPGGKIIQPITTEFWGAWIAKVVDKYGTNWFLCYEAVG